MRLILIILILLLPVKAQAQSDRLVHISIGSAMIAHGVDLSTSMYLMGQDPIRFRESNPILRPFQDNPVGFAIVKMGTAVILSDIELRIHHKHPKVALWTSIAQAGLISYVSYRNYRLIVRSR